MQSAVDRMTEANLRGDKRFAPANVKLHRHRVEKFAAQKLIMSRFICVMNRSFDELVNEVTVIACAQDCKPAEAWRQYCVQVIDAAQAILTDVREAQANG